jgi:hypothetical protein
MIGDETGVTFTVTQTGEQDITLGGVDYHITFGLSQMSLAPDEVATISATLTRLPMCQNQQQCYCSVQG